MRKISILVILALVFHSILGGVAASPLTIKVEAEDYDEAITQMKVYNVRGKVVSFQQNQWMSYDIAFGESGKYKVIITGANTSSVPNIITVDGANVSSSDIPSTGSYDNYLDADVAEFSVRAGIHTIKITVMEPISFDYFTLVKIGEFEREYIGDNNKIFAVDYDEGGEGIGYHDVTEGVDDIFAIDRGDDVEVLETPTGLAVLMSGTEWLRYTLNSPNEEAYTISFSASNQNSSAKIRVYLNDEQLFEKPLGTTTEPLTFKSNTIGHLLLPQGINTVKFELVNISPSEKIIFSHFTINKMNPESIGSGESVVVKTEFEDYMPGGQGVGYYDNTPGLDFEFYVDRGDDVEVGRGGTGLVVGAASGEWWKYVINIPQKGRYKLTVSSGTENEINTLLFSTEYGTNSEFTINGTGDWHTYKKATLGYIDLEAGEQILKVELTSGSINLDYFLLELVDGNFEFYATYAGSLPLIGKRVLPRGTDSFKIYFTIDVDDSSVNSRNIRLTGNNTEIPAAYYVDKNVVDVRLKKTLDFETEYLLSINDIVSIYGQEMSENVLVEFITGTLENDTGSGEIILSGSSMIYETVNLTGIVYSGSGEAIEGRKIMLSYTNPQGTTFQAVNAFSGEDGEFEIIYTLPENSVCGRYVFYVQDEYTVQPIEFLYAYISRELEMQILQDFAGTKTAAEVKDLFAEHEQNLGISLADDLIRIEDKNRFYKHFIGIEANDVSAFMAEYEKYIVFETINQTDDSSVVLEVLESLEKCELLGIDKAKSDLIVNNKTGFISDVSNIESKNSISDFILAYNSIVEKWLKVEYGKTDVTSSAVSKSVYVGQGVNIDIGFITTERDVKKVNYELHCEKAELFDILTTQLKIKGTAEVTKEENKVIVSIIPAKTLSNIDSLGTIICTAPGAETTYSVQISGNVIYEIAGSITVQTSILPKTITVTVKKNSSGGSPISTGGFMGKGTSVQPIMPQTPETNEQPKTEKAFSFTDLDKVQWAKDSINELLKKRIISESPDEKFYPQEAVTREQFVKMVVVALGAVASDAKTTLADVDENQWYYPYVASAQAYGLISGDDENNFGVGRQITRQDMSVIIFRAMKALGVQADNSARELFADDSEIDEYAKDAIYTMKAMKIISGVGEGRFNPKGNATRAMAAKIVFEMIKAVGL